MNEHDNNDKGMKSMMWMMAICCLLPVVVAIGGASFFQTTNYPWIKPVLFVALFGFCAWHMIGMFRGHRHDNTEQKDKNKSCH